MLGTISWQLYPVLADPAATATFRDPVANKAAIERLLGRPVRIYVAGEPYPILSYTLLSNAEDYKTVGPSGFFQLPTPAFDFHPTKHGDKRYELQPAEVAQAFEGSLVSLPSAAPVSLKKLEKVAALHRTQAQLFAEYPGIHYSLLCRALDEEGRIEELMDMTFPDADIFTKENADSFQAVSHWLATLDRAHLKKNQRSAVAEIEAIVAAVNEKRRRSGSPLGEPTIHSLISLLSLRPHPTTTALDAALASTPDINRGEDRHGYTPLMMAALHGHAAAVHEILRKGADPNRRDKDGSTALMFGCTGGNLDICEALLAARADPTLVSIDGTNALHIACTKESLTPLIPHLLISLDPNGPDGDGDTPLHLAAGWGLTEQIAILLAAGANPNAPNAAGEIPLSWAVKDGEEAVVRQLLPVSDMHTRGLVALAIKAKQDDIAVALIGAGAPVASWARVLELATERSMPRLAALAKRRLSSSERRRRTHRSNKPVF